MKNRAGSLLRLATPVKVVVQRFAFLLLLGASVGLVVLGKADTVMVERLRTSLADAFVPILEGLSRPVATVNEAIATLDRIAALQAENTRLAEENSRLREWQAVARQLEAENRQLRALLGFVPRGAVRYIAGRVIADGGGAFARSLLLNAGAEDGVAKGQAVVTSAGLVGRIARVGRRSALVLLITDLNSRIPVMLESSRERAILAGDNSDRPRLIHLPPEARVAPGDRIVTSGHAGAFPPGLAVGVVTAVDGREVRVRPLVEWNRLEIVRVVDYDLGGVIGSPSRVQGAARRAPGAAGPRGWEAPLP